MWLIGALWTRGETGERNPLAAASRGRLEFERLSASYLSRPTCDTTTIRVVRPCIRLTLALSFSPFLIFLRGKYALPRVITAPLTPYQRLMLAIAREREAACSGSPALVENYSGKSLRDLTSSHLPFSPGFFSFFLFNRRIVFFFFFSSTYELGSARVNPRSSCWRKSCVLKMGAGC